jgi:hypothetical protein
MSKMATGQNKYEQGMLDFKLKALANNDVTTYTSTPQDVNYYAQAQDLRPTSSTTTVRTSSIIPSSLDTTTNNKKYISIATTYAAGSDLYEILASQNAPGYTPSVLDNIIPVYNQDSVKPSQIFSQHQQEQPVQAPQPVIDWDDTTPIMMRGSINY